MKIASIQVGLPKIIHFKGKEILTAINKDPVDGPILLEKLNLAGDRQAELSVHGGVDKALYTYSLDAYKKWSEIRTDITQVFGGMGENLTVDSFDESKIFIGDIYKLGEAIVQVSEPRQPCFKLGAKYNDLKIIKQFIEVDRPGIYFRVLQAGLINRGDEFVLIETPEKIRLSILELSHLEHPTEADIERIKDLIQIRTMSGDWHAHLSDFLSRTIK